MRHFSLISRNKKKKSTQANDLLPANLPWLCVADNISAEVVLRDSITIYCFSFVKILNRISCKHLNVKMDIQIEKVHLSFDSKNPFENAEAFQWDILLQLRLFIPGMQLEYGCLQEVNLIWNGNSQQMKFLNNWMQEISIKTLKICLFKTVRKINKAIEIDAFMKCI